MIPKYRGISVEPNDEEKWKYGYLIEDEKESFIINQVIESNEQYITIGSWDPVRPDTVSQSTGLYDKNGKEVFEGDILEVTDKHSWLEVVSYSQEKAMFVTEEINREFKVPESPLYDLLDSTFLKFKVIGNIYENPELLEVE